MAYNPTNWECGDVVTAEKLNKLEEAVESLSVTVEGISESLAELNRRVTALEEAANA